MSKNNITEETLKLFFEDFEPGPQSFEKLDEYLRDYYLTAMETYSWYPYSLCDLSEEGASKEFFDWEIKCIQATGNEEGESCYIVWELKQYDQHHSFWRIPAWVASINHARDLNLDDAFQVNPVEKTITVYEYE